MSCVLEISHLKVIWQIKTFVPYRQARRIWHNPCFLTGFILETLHFLRNLAGDVHVVRGESDRTENNWPEGMVYQNLILSLKI